METYHSFNSEYITQSIFASLEKIEETLGYQVMFGAVGGSYSLGLQNSSSDIDCYFILNTDNSLGFVKKKIDCLIQCKRAAVDAMCVSYGELLREIEEFGKVPRRYPTILYRTEESEENVGKKDIERSDFKRSMLFRVLLSDQIIHAAVAKQKSEELADGIRIRDIIDYQFTRAYGNYREAICQKQFIPVRKYLYTVHEICTSKALMNSHQKPAMDFMHLIDGTVFSKVVSEKIADIYGKNKYASEDKGKVLVPQCVELNQFIVDSIDEIRCYLQTNVLNNERLLL